MYVYIYIYTYCVRRIIYPAAVSVLLVPFLSFSFFLSLLSSVPTLFYVGSASASLSLSSRLCRFHMYSPRSVNYFSDPFFFPGFAISAPSDSVRTLLPWGPSIYSTTFPFDVYNVSHCSSTAFISPKGPQGSLVFPPPLPIALGLSCPSSAPLAPSFPLIRFHAIFPCVFVFAGLWV